MKTYINKKFIYGIAPIVTALLLFSGVSLQAGGNGKALYLSEKYRCFSCHGKTGEGGMGPSFKGIGRKYGLEDLIHRAAHNCPPTGACSPKDLRAIAEYLRTL